MGNKINDPIARLMGLRYKSHPWHGLEVGDNAPEVITAFIEMVPTDTVKYELDKVSGYIKIDRPQKYSTVIPALYGFVPQSFCGESVAKYCMQQSGRTDILGDGDPLAFAQTCHTRWPAAFRFAPGTPWDLAAGKIDIRKAEFYGDAAALLFAEAVAIYTRKRPDERSLAVVDVPGGSHDDRHDGS